MLTNQNLTSHLKHIKSDEVISYDNVCLRFMVDRMNVYVSEKEQV